MMVMLKRYYERDKGNPDLSITHIRKNSYEVFDERRGRSFGSFDVSRIKSNLNLSDLQLKNIKKQGTTNFKIIRASPLKMRKRK